MALKPETIQALELAEAYAVGVINTLAVLEPTPARTMEIDEAIDILADICLCKEKDIHIKMYKKGAMHLPHSLHVTHDDQHTLMAFGTGATPTGHYGR